MPNEILTTVVGNLTAPPELRFTQAGKPWVTFTIASTPRFYDQDARGWKDGVVTFMPCVAWGQIAEHIHVSLSKGTRVIAQGQLASDDWEDENAVKHSRMKLTIAAIGPDLTFRDAMVSGEKVRLDDAAGFPHDDDVPMYEDDRPF